MLTFYLFLAAIVAFSEEALFSVLSRLGSSFEEFSSGHVEYFTDRLAISENVVECFTEMLLVSDYMHLYILNLEIWAPFWARAWAQGLCCEHIEL